MFDDSNFYMFWPSQSIILDLGRFKLCFMSYANVNDFRMNASAAEKNSSTNQPQLNPLRRVTRAQTRACKESEQVGPVCLAFMLVTVCYIKVQTEGCEHNFWMSSTY
jgi:hypothetical protein